MDDPLGEGFVAFFQIDIFADEGDRSFVRRHDYALNEAVPVAHIDFELV